MKRAPFRGAPAADERSARRHRPCASFLAAGIALLLLPAAGQRASGVILADNLNKPQDGVENVNRTRWLASKFRVGSGNFFLTEATLRLLQTAGGRPNVALYTDAGGKPGQMVGLLQLAGSLGGAPGNVRFTAPMSTESFSGGGSTLLSMVDLPPGASIGDFDGEFVASGTRPSGLALAGNSSYWLVVRSTGGEFAQVYTDQEKGAGPGFTPEWADSTTSGRQWTTHKLSPLLYQVSAEEGIPIVEFRIDNEAIFSTVASGLPMALVQRETVFAAAEAATRDINARLFRLRSGIAATAPGKWEIFAAGNYSARENNTIGMTAGFDADVFSGTTGFEFRPCPGFAISGALTWTDSDNALDSSIGNTDIEGVTFSTYASAKWQGLYADLLYAYTRFEHELRRDTLFGQTARANPDSTVHTLQLNLGGNFPCRGFVTGPFASLTYITGNLDGYRETGGGTANVIAPDQNFDSLVSQLGWQISRQFECRPGVKVTPQFRLGWSHEFRNESENVEVALVQTPFSVGDGRTFTPFGSFQVASDTSAPGTDALDLGAGVRIDWGERCSFFIDYAARLGRSDQVTQFVSFTASVRF